MLDLIMDRIHEWFEAGADIVTTTQTLLGSYVGASLKMCLDDGASLF